MTDLDISLDAVAGTTHPGSACTPARDGGKGIAGSERLFGPDSGHIGRGRGPERRQ